MSPCDLDSEGQSCNKDAEVTEGFDGQNSQISLDRTARTGSELDSRDPRMRALVFRGPVAVSVSAEPSRERLEDGDLSITPSQICSIRTLN